MNTYHFRDFHAGINECYLICNAHPHWFAGVHAVGEEKVSLVNQLEVESGKDIAQVGEYVMFLGQNNEQIIFVAVA